MKQWIRMMFFENQYRKVKIDYQAKNLVFLNHKEGLANLARMMREVTVTRQLAICVNLTIFLTQRTPCRRKELRGLKI